MKVHPTAIVSKKAKIAAGVEIGPFAIIHDSVVLESKVKVGPSCVIDGNTTIGKGTELYTGSIVGSQPQDLKYKGEKSYLLIGEGNIIREYCTLNPGTKEGGKTVVGNNNLFMAYSHVAHDCMVGNNCVFANNATLAGHVTVEDNVVIGGMTAIHQFVRLGKLVIIGGCSKVVQDLPPFATCDGHPARIYGLNLVGLRRYGVSRESIEQLRQAYRILFHSGNLVKRAIEVVESELSVTPEIAYLLSFIRNSQRGISRSCRMQHKQAEQPVSS